jgi:hypothetical protein
MLTPIATTSQADIDHQPKLKCVALVAYHSVEPNQLSLVLHQPANRAQSNYKCFHLTIFAEVSFPSLVRPVDSSFLN